MIRAPSVVEMGTEPEPCGLPRPFPQLNPKDTLFRYKMRYRQKETSSDGVPILRQPSESLHSFRHLLTSKTTSVVRKSLKQDYSPNCIPSRETGSYYV